MFCCCCGLISTLIIFPLLIIILDVIKRYKRARVSIEGQHVVITGGSSGIGKEVGFLCAQRGAHVTILARDVPKLEEVCREIRGHSKTGHEKINFFKADVTNYEETERVLNRCEVEIGPIDILINCAGYSYPSKIEDIPISHMKGMMEVNYMGVVNTVKCVLNSMKSRRKGKIVVVSSIGGLTGLYGFTGYSASKFALRGFAEALQMEVQPFGISVTVSFPPDTNTPALAQERRIMPLETKLISETAGVLEPSQVAASLLRDTLIGDFFSTTGFDANLATLISAGMSPMSSVLGLFGQVVLGGPLRLISLGYRAYFNHIVAKCASDKEKQKRAE